MNKVAIVEAVHARLGGTKVQAEEVVDVVIDSIVNTLKNGFSYNAKLTAINPSGIIQARSLVARHKDLML